MAGYISISIERIAIYLFFNGAYTFLIFWVASTIFFPPFTILGLALYAFVCFVHSLTIKNVTANPAPADAIKYRNLLMLLPLYILMIVISILYLFGVHLIQEVMITKIGFPRQLYTITSWFFTILSYAGSFYISFIRKPRDIRS